MKISFKSKLMVVILPLVIVGLLSLTGIAYFSFNNIIEKELTQAMSTRTSEATNHINTWLTGKLAEVQETVNSPMVKRVLEKNPSLNFDGNSESIALIDELNLARWNFIKNTYPDQYAALHIVNPLEQNEWGNQDNAGKLKARYYNVQKGASSTSPWAKAGAAETLERFAANGGVPYDVILKPSYSEAYHSNMVLMLAWLKNESGKTIAGAAASLKIEAIQEIARNIKYGQKGYGMLISDDGTFIVHPDENWAMKEKITTVNDSELTELGGLIEKNNQGVFRFGTGKEKKIAFYSKAPITNWTVVNVVYESELFDESNKMLAIMLAIASAISLIVTATIYFASSYLVKPLTKLSNFADTVSTGDLTGAVEVNSEDEIGNLAKAFNNTVKALRGLLTDINQESNKVNTLSKGLARSCDESSKATEEVAKTIQHVAENTTQQAEQVALAVEKTVEMQEASKAVTSKCNYMLETAEESHNISAVAFKAVDKAVYSMRVIVENNEKNLEESRILLNKSSEIGKIIEVITSIADQTNLLALNAAIEAARAGEQGRGFAVVADEVRKLAEQSSGAANQISTLINGIQKQISNITESMDEGSKEITDGMKVALEAGNHFEDIEKAIRNIFSVVQDVSSATENMIDKAQSTVKEMKTTSDIAEDTASATEEVSASAEEHTVTMEEIGETANELSGLSDRLNELVAKFKTSNDDTK
ncbi:methyl-accepting chemotaxis protein [Clostridium carnis]